MYFGGNYAKRGIKSIPIKVYDTPGFKDADPDNIEKNKLLISGMVLDKIHVYLLLVPTRVSQDIIGKTLTVALGDKMGSRRSKRRWQRVGGNFSIV